MDLLLWVGSEEARRGDVKRRIVCLCSAPTASTGIGGVCLCTGRLLLILDLRVNLNAELRGWKARVLLVRIAPAKSSHQSHGAIMRQPFSLGLGVPSVAIL
jgi:hypothetical protein